MDSDLQHVAPLAGLESELIVLHEQQRRVVRKPTFDAMEGWQVSLEEARLHQSGMLPCFLRGMVSTLVASIRSARITIGRV